MILAMQCCSPHVDWAGGGGGKLGEKEVWTPVPHPSHDSQFHTLHLEVNKKRH